MKNKLELKEQSFSQVINDKEELSVILHYTWFLNMVLKLGRIEEQFNQEEEQL